MKVQRETIKYMIPPEWAENEKQGLCPVCGISKKGFDPGMKKFCSEAHRQQYADKILFWDEIRVKVLQRDNYTCTECGITQEKAVEEYQLKKDTWREDNIQFLLKNPKFIDKYRAEQQGRIQDRMDEIMKLLEIISSPRSIAEHVIDHSLYELDIAKIKLPHDFDVREVPHISFEVDHITAIVNGGDQWSMDNLHTLCHDCHARKTKQDMKIHRRKQKSLTQRVLK